MTDILQLADRIERAGGACRELDCLIVQAIDPDRMIIFDPGAMGRPPHREATYGRLADYPMDGWAEYESLAAAFQAPRYTESLDAALSMVPEGGRWFKCGVNGAATGAPETRMFVCGPQDADGRFLVSGESLTDETPSGDCRAITAACLRALSLSRADDGVLGE